MPAPMDFMLEAHFDRRPDSMAPLTAGTAKVARTAMMAMTTSNSTRVKARWESVEYRKGVRILSCWPESLGVK